MTGDADQTDRMKVFVSYSRDDVEFADQLAVALVDRNFEPILDRHAIDGAENWRERLGKLILSSDAVVFVLTEHSAGSPICAWEVEEAMRLGKRIVPIAPRDVTVTPPPALADLNWIHFFATSAIPGSGMFDGLRKLDRALRIDLAWLREHTRLSERAAEWSREQSEDRLLRGRTLREAEEWLGRKPASASVDAKVSEYISASIDADHDRQRLAQLAAEREEALRRAEEAVKEAAASQARRVAAEVRLRVLSIFAFVVGVALSAGAVYGLWLAAENATKADMARAAAKEFLASNVADLAEQLVVDGGGPPAVLVALSGDPAAQGDDAQRKYNPAGYPELLNTLALAYTQNRLKTSFSASAPRDFFNDGVRDLDVSRDSKLIVSTDNENAKLWTIDGKLLTTLQGHNGKIRSVVFAPDGKTILTGSIDGTARLWSLAGQERAMISPGDGDLSAVAFSDDGFLFATASRKGTVRIWNAADSKLTRRIPAEGAARDIVDLVSRAGSALSVAFVPASDDVVVGYRNSIAIRWSDTGEVVETYSAMQRDSGVASAVNSIAFADSSFDFAMVGSSGSLDIPQSGSSTTRTFDGKIPTNAGKGIHTLGSDGPAWDVAYSKDGEGILVGFEDGAARLWNRFGEPARIITGHRDAVLTVAFAPDGSRIVTGSADGTIRIELIASAFEADIGEPSWLMGGGQFLPDGSSIVLKGNSGLTEVWSTAGKKLQTIGNVPSRIMTLSGDGKSVLMTNEDEIERWSLAGEKISSFKVESEQVDALQSSPKDGSIVMGLSDSTVAVYAANGAKLMRTDRLESAPRVVSVAFSPHGDKVAASDEDGNVWIWTPDGKLIANLPALDGRSANDIEFSPEGDSILVGYSNNVARLWSIVDKGLIAVFPDHTNKVTSVAFSPDGKQVATASEDMTARLWTRDGQLLDILWGHTDYVEKVGFSPDGTKLVTSSAYGPIRIWPISPILLLPPTEQVKLACQQLAALGATKFSEEERRRYRILESVNPDPCSAAKTASSASAGPAP